MEINSFITVAALIWDWINRRDRKEREKTNEELSAIMEGKHKEQINTRDFFLKTLEQIGCLYTIDEDDTRVYFSYQGEDFVVDVTDDNIYICIWDMFWKRVDLCDIEDFPRLIKVINDTNLNLGIISTAYTVNEEEENVVYIHSKSVVLFIPQIPCSDNYLKTLLNEFFNVHRFIENKLEQLRTAPSQIQYN